MGEGFATLAAGKGFAEAVVRGEGDDTGEGDGN